MFLISQSMEMGLTSNSAIHEKRQLQQVKI